MEWMRPAERWWPASSDSNNSSRETISPSAAGSGVRPGRTRLDGVPNTADQLKRLSESGIDLQSPTRETIPSAAGVDGATLPSQWPGLSDHLGQTTT